ncbi:MAG: rhodanese-related sulfurtransferase [Chlamydiae bacterium]|nr:rhodanese-related sulfurtransferase [Chlamydiota bacterium]
MDYAVIAYYHFFHVEDPHAEAKSHKAFLASLEGKGRIYFAEEGVNAQLALHKKHLNAYYQYLQNDSRYEGVDIKIQWFDEPPFAKLTVKGKKQLVALDRKVDLSNRGEYMTPTEWKEQLESKDANTVVIDVRNNYESAIGHFSGAIKPDVATFREFNQWLEDFKKEHDPKTTKLMTYCTGGIRCEIFSPLLKEAGYEHVYQLKGGVIRYGEEKGDTHWEGKLFVFDDRLVIPLDTMKENTIGSCHFCSKAADTYYNCANMDCNALFVACSDCISNTSGCCGTHCQHTGRVRAFDSTTRVKPFRKLAHDEKLALSSGK